MGHRGTVSRFITAVARGQRDEPAPFAQIRDDLARHDRRGA
jgi:hypothetical protein